jgi:dipeptidyl aminopeptidase/acylaminoacyl peptidase
MLYPINLLTENRMRRLLILAATIFPAGYSCAQTVPSLRQYLSIRGAGFPTISPDGSQIAFRTNITGTSQVWRVSSKSGWPQQLTFFPSSVGALKWSPTGNTIIVSADNNGDEQYQLYEVNADGTRIRPLTANPKVRHNFGGWSEDGKQIYYSSNKRDPKYFDCYLMDVASGAETLVFKMNAMTAAEALSRDGKTLIVAEAISNTDVNLYAVEVSTGKGRLLTPHTAEAVYNPIDFSADGKSIYLVTNQDRDFLNLAMIDLENGKLRFVQDEKADIEDARMSPNGRLLAYTINRDGYPDLVIWDTIQRKNLKLNVPRGISPGNFTHDSKTFCMSLTSAAAAPDVFSLNVSTSKLTRATFSSYAGIDPKSFNEPSLVHYKSFDGREIPAFLLLPKSAPQDHSLPVILSIHGGPEGQERPSFNPINQYLVSRGYAVLSPNIRGSSGYGKVYLSMDNGPKRWDALKDLAAAVDWTATQPSLNPKKVVAMGGSYGGFATLAMLVHYPDRFAAGIDMFGPADFKTFYANTASYRRSLRIAEYGDPEKDSAFLDEISPLRHVNRISAPLLVLQGAMDPRVPESESRSIYESVKSRGGISEYVLFPDEGHGFAKLPNRIKAFESVVAFLDKYVRGK